MPRTLWKGAISFAPGAPISVPIDWDELSTDLRSEGFNVLNVRERLADLKQAPRHNYFFTNQRITTKMLRTFNL